MCFQRELLKNPQVDRNVQLLVVDVLKKTEESGHNLPQKILDRFNEIFKDSQTDRCVKNFVAIAIGIVAKDPHSISKEVFDSLVNMLKSSNIDRYVETSLTVALENVTRKGHDFLNEVLDISIDILKNNKASNHSNISIAAALGSIAIKENDFSKEILDRIIELFKYFQDNHCKNYAIYAFGKIIEKGHNLPEEILDELIHFYSKAIAPEANTTEYVFKLLGDIAIKNPDLPKSTQEAIIEQLMLVSMGGYSGDRTGSQHALEKIAKQGFRFSKKIVEKLILQIQSPKGCLFYDLSWNIKILKLIHKNSLIDFSELTLGIILEFCFFTQSCLIRKDDCYQIIDVERNISLTLENGHLCIWDREGKCSSQDNFRLPSRISSSSSSSSVTSNQMLPSLSVSLAESQQLSFISPQDEIQTTLFDKSETCQALLKCYKILHSVTEDAV